jgi:hypothetical protein
MAISAFAGTTGFGCTAIDTLELLFERFESVLEADSLTVAVFVIVVLAVPAFTFATIVRVTVELAFRLPIVHAFVEVAKLPTDEVAETNVRPEGKVSEATTPVEVEGPRSPTLIV